VYLPTTRCSSYSRRSQSDASYSQTSDGDVQPSPPAQFNARFAHLYALDDRQAWKWVVLPACMIMVRVCESMFVCVLSLEPCPVGIYIYV
jgi:hypothetical protein